MKKLLVLAVISLFITSTVKSQVKTYTLSDVTVIFTDSLTSLKSLKFYPNPVTVKIDEKETLAVVDIEKAFLAIYRIINIYTFEDNYGRPYTVYLMIDVVNKSSAAVKVIDSSYVIYTIEDVIISGPVKEYSVN